MRADDVHAQVAEMHDAVLSDLVVLDARTLSRLLDMIEYTAQDMVADQHASGGLVTMSGRFLAMIQESKSLLPEAVDEVRQAVNEFSRRQAQLRRVQRVMASEKRAGRDYYAQRELLGSA